MVIGSKEVSHKIMLNNNEITNSSLCRKAGQKNKCHRQVNELP